MKEISFYAAAFLLTFGGVRRFRRWSLRRRLLDVPNERSSHTAPTPRGGGLIIVIVSLAGYALAANFLSNNFHTSYLLGAVLIALVSWLDDLYTVSFVWRFLIHSLAAALVIFNLGYFDAIGAPLFQNFNLGLIGLPLTFFWIVWLTNAYNFMDGIDGIAGMQALTAGIGWLLVGKIFGLPATAVYGGVIAFSSLGFLILNWQPAKIFMGDVGSAFLGYSFAVLPLLAQNEAGANSEVQRFLLPSAVFLVWLFVFDTLWTFARRVLNREKVWQAHRGHIYQKFVIGGFSHRFIAGLYGLLSTINVGLTLLYLNDKNWGIVIFLLIALQSAGLILGFYLIRRAEVSKAH